MNIFILTQNVQISGSRVYQNKGENKTIYHPKEGRKVGDSERGGAKKKKGNTDFNKMIGKKSKCIGNYNKGQNFPIKKKDFSDWIL